jgi:hypothetical protein
MGNPGIYQRLETIVRLVLLVVVTGGVLSGPAPAQEKKEAGKADSVFDDEKEGAAKKDAGDAKDKDAAGTKPGTPSDRDTIGFNQQNVAAQMNELEERMFRLSEALRGLEPENASRLSLALRFSREEQIIEQMRETQKLLKEAQLAKAETEVKELLAKLEHLRNLLLAEDLDFQLKLARLRQMRETLAQLDRIIKEQRRGLGWSRFAMEQGRRLERFAKRRPDLEALVRDQQAVIADTKDAAKGGEKSAKEALSGIRERESKLRGAATALANDPLFADLQPPHLRRADAHLADAAASLQKDDSQAAVAAAEKALGLLRDELALLDDQAAQTRRTIEAAAFRQRSEDQARNHEAAEKLGVLSARLGDAGVALRKDLIRATAAMQSAGQNLGKAAAKPAADDQASALDVLGKSRDDLADSVERLLEQLRSELRTRLIRDLVEMHEGQMAIREITQAQAPRVQQKSRIALVTVGSLSPKEGELGERTEHLLALVEETEFGIALPTTLRILAREMRSIEGWLKAGDVAPRTIAMETRLEQDMVKLTGAVRQLPSETPPAPGTALPLNQRERERELSRLIAELTMVRMLQARLNDDTVGVDKTRPAASALPPAFRRDVETLESTQDEIRDSLAKIAERLEFPNDNNQ